MSDQGLPREQRLRQRRGFQAVSARGRRVHTAHFVVLVLPREDELHERRLGITVSKKVARDATRRNRVKRVVREVFRRDKERFPEGCDIVLIAKQQADALGYDEVAAELEGARRAMASAAHRARRDARAGDR